MAKKVSDRMRWGVDTMNVQPGDRVLEVGCGHGVAVSLVCERLGDGRLMAIDRSEKMLAAARARNARWIEVGKAELLLAAFPDVDLGDRRFSKIFAVHVPLVRGARHAALATLRRLLLPGGAVFLIAQPLHDEEVEPWTRATADHLRAGGFAVHPPRFSDHRPVRTACVSATKQETD